MSKKYSIGFLIVSFVLIILISGAYQVSYQAAVKESIEESERQATKKEPVSLETKGNASNLEGFYIMEKNGFLVVYYSDRKTVFEYTSIEINSLPEQLRQQVKNGKYVKDTKELYSILENYSS